MYRKTFDGIDDPGGMAGRFTCQGFLFQVFTSTNQPVIFHPPRRLPICVGFACFIFTATPMGFG